MTYRLHAFGTLVWDDYDNADNIGPASARTNLSPLASGGAFDGWGSNPAPMDAAKPSKKFTLVADTPAALHAQHVALRALVSKRDRLYRQVLATGALEWTWARLMALPVANKAPAALTLDIETQFELPRPAWNGVHHGGWGFDGGVALDGLALFGEGDAVLLTGSPQTVTATNGGNRPVTNLAIIVLAGSAPITALKITLAPCELQYTGTINAGQALVIDCGAQSITNNLVDAYTASFTFTANHKCNDWLRLQPGANAITVTYTGGGVGSIFNLRFSDTWN